MTDLPPTAHTKPPHPAAVRTADELRAATWGLFVHWSLGTFSGVDWTPAATDISCFQPQGLDLSHWADCALEAEMGYLAPLTKHHDGFCLWDTDTSERKVTHTTYGKDFIEQAQRVCEKKGIKLAIYFSEGDWTFDDAVDRTREGGSNAEAKRAQLEELLTRYGPIAYIWFDHAIGDGGLSHAETAALVKEHQPGCLVGFNHGEPAGELRLGEIGRPSTLDDPSGAGEGARDAHGHPGYLLAEFDYPTVFDEHGKPRWFYDPSYEGCCRAAHSIYADYLGARVCGNIFSLNVGPDRRGRLRDIDAATLRRVGDMIRATPAPVFEHTNHLAAEVAG